LMPRSPSRCAGGGISAIRPQHPCRKRWSRYSAARKKMSRAQNTKGSNQEKLCLLKKRISN
jgi:hypothetical protein